MSLKGIKSFAAKLHVDEELRQRFASDPDGVLSQLRLRSEEKAAIKSAHLQVGADGTLAFKEETGPLSWWFG